MPRLLLRSLVLGLLMTAGLAAPSFAAGAAGDQPPPPPIDWSDLIDGLSETPKDFIVGEEMC
ncbi:MAG: hypothetical protein IIB67_04625 [Proteobacteria bacterium]|nr:hypothetical protein [Pseudomonadota bacterium]